MIAIPVFFSLLTREQSRIGRHSQTLRQSQFLPLQHKLEGDAQHSRVRVIRAGTDPKAVAFDKLYFDDFQGFLCILRVFEHFRILPLWGVFTLESQ